MRGRWAWMLVAGLALAGLVCGAGVTPVRAAPAGYPVSGIDVSAYQGQVDWAAVAAGGAKFAYVRASEQAGIADSYFTANYQAAKANGLYAGAYHRARPDLSSGKAQADYFLDHAGYISDGKTLPPMLDIEWPRAEWTGLDACYNMTPAQMSSWISGFVTEVAKRTGQRAMIYTNTNWWNQCTGSNPGFGSYPLFIASYTASPPLLPAGWTTWTFWQYSDSGTLPGDQDVFSGDPTGLTRLTGAPPVSLRAHANGRYVTAENAGSKPLIANRAAVGAWEKFKLVVNADGSISLLANANGRYVTASTGSAPLIADSTTIGPAQKFYRTTS